MDEDLKEMLQEILDKVESVESKVEDFESTIEDLQNNFDVLVSAVENMQMPNSLDEDLSNMRTAKAEVQKLMNKLAKEIENAKTVQKQMTGTEDRYYDPATGWWREKKSNKPVKKSQEIIDDLEDGDGGLATW